MRPPNWYLDALVASQKREVHLEWIRRHVPAERMAALLKTDCFEEAHGHDELLFSLPVPAGLKIGIDIDACTAHLAACRRSCASSRFASADVRCLPFATGSFDLVLSNSTLDHFERACDLAISVRELARVLKPGGLLLITLDNPQNPLYRIFRSASRWCGLAFRLGHTASRKELATMLEASGLTVLATDWLIHNPRFLSTLLFLTVRRLAPAQSDRIITASLRLFARLGTLPTRPYTAAFVALCARKPAEPQP